MKCYEIRHAFLACGTSSSTTSPPSASQMRFTSSFSSPLMKSTTVLNRGTRDIPSMYALTTPRNSAAGESDNMSRNTLSMDTKRPGSSVVLKRAGNNVGEMLSLITCQSELINEHRWTHC